MQYTIRHATSSDFPIIQGLNAALFKSDNKNDDALDLNWPYSPDGIAYYKKALEDPEKIVLISEDEKGEAVGYLIGCSRNKFGYRTVKTGELENMYVVPRARREGVGRRLVNELKKWLRNKEIHRLYVSAFVKNEDAVAFYRSVGFSDWELGLEIILSNK